MSVQSELHQYVDQQFRQAFGNPENSLGRDDHWSLRPGPSLVAINVLVNGTAEHPAVWVFDPHIPNDGVLRKMISSKDDVHEMVKQIQARMQAAAANPWRPNAS